MLNNVFNFQIEYDAIMEDKSIFLSSSFLSTR